MSLAIIHLTDLHLNESTYNNVGEKYKYIARACYSVIHDGDDVLLLFTGDITNRGRISEFEKFEKLLNSIIMEIESEKKVKVHFACVPGNHDCVFSEDESEQEKEISKRDSIVEQIKKPSLNIDDTIDRYVSEVQKNYQEFISKYNFKRENCLVNSLSVRLQGGKNVKIFMLNSSWSSKPKEKPKDLSFPVQYIRNLETDCDFSIFLCHHPYSWFEIKDEVEFEKQMRVISDILFLGHEHRFDKVTTKSSEGNYLKLNGEELQNSKDESLSKFAVYILSGQSSEFSLLKQHNFVWEISENGKGIYKHSERDEEPFSKNRSHNNFLYIANENYQSFLNDLGMSVKHYRIGELRLSDIYCSPDLLRYDFEKADFLLDSKRADPFAEISNSDITLIVGDTMSGKTSLAKSLYSEFNRNEYNCLFLEARRVTSCKEKTLEKLVYKLFEEQYDAKLIDEFQQLTKSNKAVIVDNIQNFTLDETSRNQFFKFLNNFFSKIVVFSNMDFDNLLMMSQVNDLGINNYSMYKIKTLSKTLQLELIKKWHNLGQEYAQPEDDTQERIETSAKIVNKIIDSRAKIVPAYPINVIFLLYTEASGLPTNNQISQYGFLYETLVTKSLINIPDYTPPKMNLYLGFLSEVAYYMLNLNTEACDHSGFNAIVENYSKIKMVDLDSSKLISEMVICNILVVKGDEIRFKYPYIYYYFVSKYIVNNLNLPVVKRKVEDMCSCLYNEAYGNIMIFVCHFANSDEIIDNILINALDIVSSAKQFDFSQKQTELLTEVNKKIDAILSKIAVDE